MLAKPQFRTLRSISKRTLHQSSTRTWQPLPSRPAIICSRCPAAQRRYYTNPNRAGVVRRIGNRYRDSPFTMTLWTIGIFGILAYSGLTLRKRYEKIEAIRKIYPDPVAKELDKAIWYTNERSDVHKAVEHYNKAIKEAERLGLPAFSQEVIGIRIRIAETWEIFNEPMQAITVLDSVKTNSQEFLVKESFSIPPSDRSITLIWIVRIHFKIASLYGSDAIRDSATAERYMTEGIEIILKEQQRQQEEGIPEEDMDENSKWFYSSEAGAAFEQLADHYGQESKHHFAAPLYLHALRYGPENCHAAVVMNNLAASLAQIGHGPSSHIPTDSETLLENAIYWGKNALVLAQGIKPPDRDEDCDATCVTATFHLALFEGLRGRHDEARKLYVEALSLAKAMNQHETIRKIEDVLQSLDSRTKNQSAEQQGIIEQHGSGMVDER